MDGFPLPAGPRPTPRASRRWVAHARHQTPSRPFAVEGGNRVAGGRPVVDESLLIEIDGSDGEGGGQVLRSALTLSLLTGRGFRITQIRANRTVPGLRPQHLASVQAAAQLGGAEVQGAEVGSRELTFLPGAVRAEDFRHDIGTAGASALVLQTIHLPLALRGDRAVRATIEGGTFNTMAPSFPFLDCTWRPLLAAIGLPIALTMPTAGFYPKGGGRIEAWIEPGRPKPLHCVEKGRLLRISGVAGGCGLDRSIAEKLRTLALRRLAEKRLDAEIQIADWPGRSTGAALSLTVEHETAPPATFVALGERGKPSEKVAHEAVAELVAFTMHPGAIDPHSADQILLPLAFAQGRSEYTVAEVTEHLRTNARTLGLFLDRAIVIDESLEDQPGRVVIA